MKYQAFVLSFAAAKYYNDPENPCRKKSSFTTPENVRIPLEPVKDLPDTYIWNNVNGTNFLTNIKNQHLPQYCGSCWAQAATSSMSDRIKIARNAAWPDVNIAPQTVISCSSTDGNNGCHGGEAYSASAWMAENDIADETCSIYRGLGLDNLATCSSIIKCMNCDPNKGCWA